VESLKLKQCHVHWSAELTRDIWIANRARTSTGSTSRNSSAINHHYTPSSSPSFYVAFVLQTAVIARRQSMRLLMPSSPSIPFGPTVASADIANWAQTSTGNSAPHLKIHARSKKTKQERCLSVLPWARSERNACGTSIYCSAFESLQGKSNQIIRHSFTVSCHPALTPPT